jgi:hypothetical protein
MNKSMAEDPLKFHIMCSIKNKNVNAGM